MNTARAYYMIESGKALEMIKHHIAEQIRVQNEILSLLSEIGMTNREVWRDIRTGVLTSIHCKRGEQPEGFTVPDVKGRTHPKKGTDWAKRFEAQRGHVDPSVEIAEALNIPLTLAYTSEDGGRGSRHIGLPLARCGYLFMGVDGPYAMWIPDVEKLVAEHEGKGDMVTGPAKQFSMRIEGCRRIDPKEWEILVKQHELAQMQRDLAAQQGQQGSHCTA